MPTSNLIRFGGGLASVVSGLLLLLGHILNLGGDSDYGTVLGASSVLIAHAALVFALVALYAAQAEQSDLLGSIGMVLSVIGTILVTAVVFVQIAGASGVMVDAVLTTGVSGTLNVLGGLLFFVGLILFGLATMRAGVFPRWSGLLLVVGDIVFAVGSFAGSAVQQIIVVLGALITCAGFVWLGLALLSGSDATTQRAARVSSRG
jgi:hypothetical protein